MNYASDHKVILTPIENEGKASIASPRPPHNEMKR
jgi:hypothetical protein